MKQGRVATIQASLAAVTDPRGSNRSHRLIDILVIAIHNTETDNLVANLRGEVGDMVFT